MMRALILLLVCGGYAHAQGVVVKEEITHINRVKLARPIVVFDRTATATVPLVSSYYQRPPLLKIEERITVRGQPLGYTIQTQRPFVQLYAPACRT